VKSQRLFLRLTVWNHP